MAADIQFEVELVTREAEKQLRDLNNSVTNATNSFAKLGSVIGGLAIGAFIGNALKMSHALSDSAKAVGFTTKQFAAFGEALARNGGEFNNAGDAASDFVKNIGEAANGSSELQSSFSALGISLSDLANLSESDLFGKALEGLKNIPDTANRSAVALKLFGGSFKVVDVKSISDDFKSLSNSVDTTADAIDSAADVSRNIADSYRILQTETLKALKPFSDLAVILTKNKEVITALIQTVLSLASAFAVLFIIPKIVAGFVGLAGAVRTVIGLFSVAGAGAALFSGGLLRFIPIIGKLYIAFELLNGAVKVISSLFGAGSKGIVDWGRSALEALGIVNKKTAETTQAANQLTNANDEQAKSVRTVVDANKQNAQSLKEISDEYKKVNQAVQRRLQDELQLIGLSESMRKGVEAGLQLDADYAAAVANLNKKKKELANTEGKTADEIKNNQRAIAVLNSELKQLTAEYEKQKNTLPSWLNALEDSTRIINLQQFSLDQQASSLLKVTDIYADLEKVNLSEVSKQLFDIEYAANKMAAAAINAEQIRRGAPLPESEQKAYYEAARQNIEKVKNAVEQLNLAEQERRTTLALDQDKLNVAKEYRKVLDSTTTLTMSEMEKQEYELISAAKERANAFIEAEKARRGTDLSNAEQKQIIEGYINNTKELIKATNESYKQSRTFAVGWKQAMNDYVSVAGNSAAKAKSIFAKSMQGMEDLIVDFAKTGKFQWKNFVAMMLEELLRAQIQAIFAGMIGDMSNSMRGSSGFGGGNKQSPGLLETIGSIGNTIGGWFGGGTDQYGLSKGSQQSQMLAAQDAAFDTSWLDDISNFFGGFFADGGRLGAGKWGVAGEAGPELISGPANITPMSKMGGGSTNVTYNIVANDARSFKEMLAADPSFIYGLTMQGAKSIPARR